MNFQKMFKTNNMDFDKNILHNKYLLYVIFFVSVGNFFIEMMNNNMYFVSIYILIGILMSFFNKNMIVILSLTSIFTNILKYGRATTLEGFESEETDVEKALHTDTSRDGEIIDEIVEGKEHKKEKKEKKEKKHKSHHHSDSDSDDSDDEEEHHKEKKKRKKEGLKQYSDEDMDNMDYEKSEQLLKNQKQLLKNMKEYKPFLDTIQGLAKNISGLVKEES